MNIANIKLKRLLLKYINFLSLFVLAIFLFIQCFYILPNPSDLFNRKLLYFGSTLIFSLFLNQIHQCFLKLFIAISILLSIMVYPVHNLYGNINYTFLTNVFYTTPSEAISYIKLISYNILLKLTVFIIIGVWLIKQNFYKFKNKKNVYICLILLLILPSKKIWVKINEYKDVQREDDILLEYYSNIIAIKKILFISENLIAISQQHRFTEEELRKPDTWQIVSQGNLNKKNLIVVIGESVQKNMLHSYGFPIKNTPFIDDSPHIKFENFISSSYTTIQSLRPTLSLSADLVNYQSNNNIITLANRIGYDTYWISNQNSLGKYDSPISVIGKRAKEHYFFNGKIRDEEMYPIVDEILDKNIDTPKLIIIHMAGSHPRICDITKGKYDEFILSKEISCYNKTIKELDNFLGNIYKSLISKKDDFGLIYFSDHGLSLTSDLSATHILSKESVEVPFLVWSNEITYQHRIYAHRTGKDFLHFFSEFIGVKTKNIKNDYIFISEEKIDNIKVLENDKETILYNDLEYKKPIHNEIKKSP